MQLEFSPRKLSFKDIPFIECLNFPNFLASFIFFLSKSFTSLVKSCWPSFFFFIIQAKGKRKETKLKWCNLLSFFETLLNFGVWQEKRKRSDKNKHSLQHSFSPFNPLPMCDVLRRFRSGTRSFPFLKHVNEVTLQNMYFAWGTFSVK